MATAKTCSRSSAGDHRRRPLLTRQEIVDHMSFLMMAAHDTLTSSLTSFVYFLATHPDWQQKIRDEIAAVGLPPDAPLPYEKLDALPLTEMAFKGIAAPHPARAVIAPLRHARHGIHGVQASGGHARIRKPPFTHHMADVWVDPETFDPLRFSDEASRNRHKYAFVPFGGGAHMCLGLHFAYMQAKCFAWHLFAKNRVTTAPGYRPDWKLWPIPQPRDGLRVQLKPIA